MIIFKRVYLKFKTIFIKILKFLVKRNIDNVEKDNCKNSCLYHACKEIKTATVKLLIDKEGIDINEKDEYGKTVLHYLSKEIKPDKVKFLIDKLIDIKSKDKYKQIPLYCECKNNVLEIVKFLIDKDIDIYVQDNNEQTALHYACETNTLNNVNVDIAKILIDKAISEGKKEYCISIFNYACEQNNTKIIIFLIEKDLNNYIFYNEPPFQILPTDDMEILFNKNVNVYIEYINGETYLCIAVNIHNGKLVSKYKVNDKKENESWCLIGTKLIDTKPIVIELD